VCFSFPTFSVSMDMQVNGLTRAIDMPDLPQ
jgi:hypothetical protein